MFHSPLWMVNVRCAPCKLVIVVVVFSHTFVPLNKMADTIYISLFLSFSYLPPNRWEVAGYPWPAHIVLSSSATTSPTACPGGWWLPGAPNDRGCEVHSRRARAHRVTSRIAIQLWPPTPPHCQDGIHYIYHIDAWVRTIQTDQF